MRHVLIDRPRWHSRRRHPGRAKQRRWDEDSPTRAPVSRRGGTRGLSDHLGPLKRFLMRRRGQPWDRVYGEICRQIDRRSTLERHILEHLDHMVYQQVELRDGVPWVLGASGARPLRGEWRNCYYVEPGTGLLRAAPMTEAPR